MKPKKVAIKNDYVSAYDAERIRRSFVNSNKSAAQIALEYGLPSAEVVLYVVSKASSPGSRGHRVDIREMEGGEENDAVLSNLLGAR